MKLWSISFSYRLGLGFHALNNEGADGSNLMQPRRIDVGKITYDGISGEIIRHHIMENFVNICRADKISMFPLSEGLHPDRGPLGIRAGAKLCNDSILSNGNLYKANRKAIESCAVLDVGGYLAAWEKQAKVKNSSDEQEKIGIDNPASKEQSKSDEKQGNDYLAEQSYIERYCVNHNKPEPIKRESCFDVAWLISEEPQDLTITQHSAYRDTAEMNSRYAQTMRSNVYAGIIRADLHRVGTDDNWYLQDEMERLAITPEEQMKRQMALIQAITNFIASPTGAKVAGWAPHVFLIEGAILLTSSRTAPFYSPIKVALDNLEKPIQADSSYLAKMSNLAGDNDEPWIWTFKDVRELLFSTNDIKAKMQGKSYEKKESI